jgi:uncharacterized protein YcfL
MQQKWVGISVLVISFLFTACSKQNQEPVSTEASSVQVNEISTEQQAAIDALDQPILDEKNTDIPAEIANAPADEATVHQESTDLK